MDPLREGFERLVIPLQKSIYFAALAMVHRETDALDLVQETLLKAWRGFASFDQGGNLKAWLFTILRNAHLDGCRRRRIDPLPLDPLAEPATSAPVPLPPGEQLPDDLLRALSSLSSAHRMVLLLCDIEGLRYREIAETLGWPIGSVMSCLHNARTRLKQALLDHKNAPRRG
jgi:RNA polymerase sigma-70 factor (ECF subfamily)